MLKLLVIGGAILTLTAALLAAPTTQPALQANRWELRNPDGPNITWENGIAYDPTTRLIVWYGGHAWGYPQSNYTHLYDIADNAWHDSKAPYRPQRRCLVMVNYLDSCRRIVCTQGGTGHGSIPEGGFVTGGDYKKLVKADPRGPWLYDASADRWENCRTLPPIWKREAHAQCAYDATTDSLVWLTGDKLGLYCPRTNRVSYRDLPKELHKRLAYGIAADPMTGKVVVFGGTGPGGLNWVKEDKAVAYKTYIHNDTWTYDVAADKWKQCHPNTVPPRGMPLFDHRFIPMVYHTASGTILMQQTPLDAYEADTTKWPATQFWSFDAAAEEWTLVPMENTPPFQGLLGYAITEDLLVLVGGGKDGEARDDNGKLIYRPSLSKQLWTCRVNVPGKSTKPIAVSATFHVKMTRFPSTQPTALVQFTNQPEVVVNYKTDVPLEIQAGTVDGFPKKYATLKRVGPGEGQVDGLMPGSAKVAFRAVTADGSPVGLPFFTQPWRPGGLLASVESDKKVVLRWNPNKEADLAGYNVYRAAGAEVEKAEAKKLNEKLVEGITFTDETANLSDGVARSYWVTAVNKAGLESGACPLAYTFPDPPLALNVVKSADGKSLKVTWDWPKDNRIAGVNVYHLNNHWNTHGEPPEKVKAWYDSWKTITDKPVAAGEAAFQIPAEDAGKHHYFYLRAVNVLGQEGFYTDIASATDKRFHP